MSKIPFDTRFQIGELIGFERVGIAIDICKLFARSWQEAFRIARIDRDVFLRLEDDTETRRELFIFASSNLSCRYIVDSDVKAVIAATDNDIEPVCQFDLVLNEQRENFDIHQSKVVEISKAGNRCIA